MESWSSRAAYNPYACLSNWSSAYVYLLMITGAFLDLYSKLLTENKVVPYALPRLL